MRSCSRAPAIERQKGFVLLAVLVLAVLYFAMIGLLLMESTAAYRGAERFRSRVVAQVLAENAAELAARGLVTSGGSHSNMTMPDGSMHADCERIGDRFTIVGTAHVAGAVDADASVRVYGRVEGTRVIIERTVHSQ